jgi:polyphosphate glucokinase
MESFGLDIGGSGIKGAVVDVERGSLITPRFRLPTPEGAEPDDMAGVVKAVVAHFGWNGSIGSGFPAVVTNGEARTAANIHPSWIGVNIEKIFGTYIGLPVHVLNDADAAGMAEMRFGAGAQYKKGVVLMITVGTGIGTAVFINGALLPNTEFGHIEVRGKDAERRASDATRQRKKLTWEEWGEVFNEYLDTMERLIYPDVIIVGGGISKQWGKFEYCLNVRAPVLPAQFLNEAGIIGAAVYASEQTH